jgi:cell division protein FtsZ
MTLGDNARPQAAPVVEKKQEDELAPTLIDEESEMEIPMPQLTVKEEEAQLPLEFFELGAAAKKEEPKEEAPASALQLKFMNDENSAEAERDKERKELAQQKQALEDKFEALRMNILGGQKTAPANPNAASSAAGAGGYLSRPSNIYSESKKDNTPQKQAEESPRVVFEKAEQDEALDMQLVIRSEAKPEGPAPESQQPQTPQAGADMQQTGNAGSDDKQRAADRLQKLRNLSFNLNAADPNNELENVPAYIRRNMDLYQGSSSVENFYSSYTVKSDGKNSATISTINTFLDGKKPD